MPLLVNISPTSRWSPRLLLTLGCLLSYLFVACQPCGQFEPQILYFPQKKQIQSLPSSFSPLSKEEYQYDWAKELYIGMNFAHDMDLYRAITALKRALIILPKKHEDRRLQIEYGIFECYYLGHKYTEAIEVFDNGPLSSVPGSFPAVKELLIMLTDCYDKTDQIEKRDRIFCILEKYSPEAAESLKLSFAMTSGDLDIATGMIPTHPAAENLEKMMANYHASAKSISKAHLLNGLLPGAGYLYVGQKKTALTSFCINALFIGATYYFFKNHNIPAGIITASLETGWYVGGMNGAGLAAKEYNEHLYQSHAKEALLCNRLFPVLMLEKAF
jgi:hypothetical protein